MFLISPYIILTFVSDGRGAHVNGRGGPDLALGKPNNTTNNNDNTNINDDDNDNNDNNVDINW